MSRSAPTTVMDRKPTFATHAAWAALVPQAELGRQAQHLVTLGGKGPFAAISANVRYVQKAGRHG